MRDSDLEVPINKTNVEWITNPLFAFTMTLPIRDLAEPALAARTEEAIADAAFTISSIRPSTSSSSWSQRSAGS